MAAGNSADPVRSKLLARGVPEHIVREGADGLIRRWRDFVAAVEKGYTLGLDDYRNDLDVRTLIAFAGLDAQVSREDDRLRNLLAGDQALWESDCPDAYWVRGYPRNASGELRSDLIAEGLLEEVPD